MQTCSVIFQVDENTRKSLYKLRSTWEDIFTSKKLYALDVRVNQVDPAWPVKPLPPNVNTASIHVNPKFLNKVSINGCVFLFFVPNTKCMFASTP